MDKFSGKLLSPKNKVLIWVFISVLLAISGFILGTKTVLPGPANLKTLLKNPAEKLAIESGVAPKDSLLIILNKQNEIYSSADFSNTLENLRQQLLQQLSPQTQHKLFSNVQTINHSPFDNDKFISKDLHSVLLVAETAHSIDVSAEELIKIKPFIETWNNQNPRYNLFYLSDGTINDEMFDLINSDLDTSLIYTLPITFIILLWAFGSLYAAIIPLIIAIISLLCSLGLTALFSNIFTAVSATAEQLVVLLVLAIGIDYSLFIISRAREEVLAGLEFKKAVERASKTAGVAIFWSGVIVALSLCGLFLMQDTILASMALVSIISVLITVLSATWILPALLLLFGQSRICLKNDKEAKSVVLEKLLTISINHPIKVLLITVALLLFISSFAAKIILGSTVEPQTLPKSLQSNQAFEFLQKTFPDLAGTDFSIILQAKDLSTLEEDGELQDFFDALNNHPTVKGPIKIDRSTNGELMRFQFIALGSGNDSSNKELIHSINEHYFQKLLPATIKVKGLSGTLPYVVNESEHYWSRTPTVLITVMGLSFIFLLIAFRSIVVPIKAMLLNIISTTSAFGFLVIFFQILPVASWHFSVIESFIPPLLFSILFGLSMDYHVFIISRIYEEYSAGKSTKDAIIIGIKTTYKTVSSAAIIMVAVFGIIASLQLPIMKELGLGLATAVLLDATIIRCFILPASMVLLDKNNWYLPSFFRFFEYFKK